jgi:general secretion pathway protein A
MYTSFYNLTKKPFQISSDPSFMWMGEKHREALAVLKYGILDNKGFLLLTGDVGTGKTTLINTLIQSITDDIICTSVPDPGLEKLDFFNYIAAGFGIGQEFSTKGTFLAHFRQFLMEANENGKKVLLIIDEAQLLTQEMLEEIRLLSNIEKADTKLINIFFVGQNEFNEILNREQNRAVRQRLTLNYNIDPLTPDETGEYIWHRLSVAGATYSIFDESATQEVFMYSGGFPRRINVICDHCLLSGYVKEKKIIDAAIVRECAKELKIPAHIRNRDINGFAQDFPSPGPLPPPGTPAAPQTARPGAQKPETHRFMLFITILAFIASAVFAWSYLFPEDYKTVSDALLAKFHEIVPQNISYPEKNITPLHKDSEPSLETPRKRALPDQEKTAVPDIAPKKSAIIHPIQEEPEKQKTGQVFTIPVPVPDEPKAPAEHNMVPEPGPAQKTTQTADADSKPLQTHINEKTDGTENIAPAAELPDKKTVIRFRYNTNDFTEQGYATLVKFADILIKHPEAKIMISGYTDSQGSEKYNRHLSEFRANIVGSFFLGRGIKPEQMQIRGMGSKNPLEANDTAWGRMMNRRVEIEIISPQVKKQKID